MKNESRIDDIRWYEKHPWMQTYSGQKFHFLDPHPDEIRIVDIAHSLSLQCRYAGHVKKFYSVAEHCVHMSNNCNPKNALWALLHDASEAYMVDICRPVKAFLSNYKDMESVIMKAIASKYGLLSDYPEEVHELDSRILFNEKILLSKIDWGWEMEPIAGLDLSKPWSSEIAERKFLQKFAELNNISFDSIKQMNLL